MSYNIDTSGDNKHLVGSFGLGVLAGLQRKPIYPGHIFDPRKPAKKLAAKHARKAQR